MFLGNQQCISKSTQRKALDSIMLGSACVVPKQTPIQLRKRTTMEWWSLLGQVELRPHKKIWYTEIIINIIELLGTRNLISTLAISNPAKRTVTIIHSCLLWTLVDQDNMVGGEDPYLKRPDTPVVISCTLLTLHPPSISHSFNYRKWDSYIYGKKLIDIN